MKRSTWPLWLIYWVACLAVAFAAWPLDLWRFLLVVVGLVVAVGVYPGIKEVEG